MTLDEAKILAAAAREKLAQRTCRDHGRHIEARRRWSRPLFLTRWLAGRIDHD